MDRLSLKASERSIIGKKVKHLRKEGKLPAHVFGKGLDTEHITVDTKEFIKLYGEVGATGLVDLKIGEEKVKPVMVKDVQYNPVTDELIHIDFYHVNLSVKVTVPVPVEIIGGEEIETVKSGEAIVLQNIDEVEVEALPTDLIEKIEVNVDSLKNIDDAITVEQLNVDKSKITILTDPETVVVKLAPAVSAEMEALLEEQAAEVAAATEEQAVEDGEKAEDGDEEGHEAVDTTETPEVTEGDDTNKG